jgi:hypothetical protein
MIFLWKSGSKLMAKNGSILLAIDSHYPISIVKASYAPVDCLVFGEQIDIITASPRPKSTRFTLAK